MSGLRLVMSKEGASEVGPIKITFHFNTDVGRFTVRGSDTVEEMCELVPMQIQNAGAMRRLMLVLAEVVQDGS